MLQVMVNSEVSGVGFSRHPLTPLSTDHVLVEAVYGLGEGLVSGEFEADRYEVCTMNSCTVDRLTNPNSLGLEPVQISESFGLVNAYSLNEELLNF